MGLRSGPGRKADRVWACLSRRRRPRVWPKKAAAAGQAATLAVVPAACKEDGSDASHPTEEVAVPADAPSFATEMVAPPVADVGGASEPDAAQDQGISDVRETVAAPPDAGSTDTAPAAPDAAAPGEAVPAPDVLATAFDGQAVRYRAERITPVRDLQIELTLDDLGEVTHGALHAASIPSGDKRERLAYLRSLSFGELGVPAGRYRLDLSRERQEEMLREGTFMFEEAPYPTCESEMIAPPTQMHERAPAPPTHLRELAPERLELDQKKGDPEKR